MKPIELLERDERVVRVDPAGSLVHRVEQGTQLGLARRLDWRQHHEIRLRSHRSSLEDFVARRLVMRHGVLGMAKPGERLIHAASGAALIA